MDSHTLGSQAQDVIDETLATKGAARARRFLQGSRSNADAFAARGKEAIRSGMSQARESFDNATERTASYVQAQPLKAVLWAAAAGAVIGLVAGALGRGRYARDRD